MNIRRTGVLSMSEMQDRAITKVKLSQLWSRMLRTARFKSDAYLELANDKGATGQAVAVLFLAALSYAFGFTLFNGPLVLYSVLVGILTSLLLSLIAGLVWAITVFLVGTKLFQGKTRFWDLARPLFFATAPGIFFVFIAIPAEVVFRGVTAVVAFWIIACGVVATKNAMGFSYTRSMLTYTVGFL